MDIRVRHDGGREVEVTRMVAADDLSQITILDDDDNVVMPNCFVWVADIRARETGGPCEVFIAQEGADAMRETGLFFPSWVEAEEACGVANSEHWTEDEVGRIVFAIHGGGSG